MSARDRSLATIEQRARRTDTNRVEVLDDLLPEGLDDTDQAKFDLRKRKLVDRIRKRTNTIPGVKKIILLPNASMRKFTPKGVAVVVDKTTLARDVINYRDHCTVRRMYVLDISQRALSEKDEEEFVNTISNMASNKRFTDASLHENKKVRGGIVFGRTNSSITPVRFAAHRHVKGGKVQFGIVVQSNYTPQSDIVATLIAEQDITVADLYAHEAYDDALQMARDNADALAFQVAEALGLSTDSDKKTMVYLPHPDGTSAKSGFDAIKPDWSTEFNIIVKRADEEGNPCWVVYDHCATWDQQYSDLIIGKGRDIGFDLYDMTAEQRRDTFDASRAAIHFYAVPLGLPSRVHNPMSNAVPHVDKVEGATEEELFEQSPQAELNRQIRWGSDLSFNGKAITNRTYSDADVIGWKESLMKLGFPKDMHKYAVTVFSLGCYISSKASIKFDLKSLLLYTPPSSEYIKVPVGHWQAKDLHKAYANVKDRKLLQGESITQQGFLIAKEDDSYYYVRKDGLNASIDIVYGMDYVL